MSTKNMYALRGQTTPMDVLYIDPAAGHASVAEAAEHRFFILDTITKVLSCAKMESTSSSDQANLCLVLNTLIEEARGLSEFSYQLALTAAGPERKK